MTKSTFRAYRVVGTAYILEEIALQDSTKMKPMLNLNL